MADHSHDKSATVLRADEVALAISSDREVTLSLPAYVDVDEVPRLSLFLVASMNKMVDEAWVEEIISEILPDDLKD